MKAIGKIMIMDRSRSRESGTALVMALFIITVLTVLGTMVLNTSIVEIKMAGNQKISSQVFYAAEAGLERGILMLLADFEIDAASGAPWGNSIYANWPETVTEAAVTGSTTFDEAVRSLDMYMSSNDTKLKKLTLSGGHTVNVCQFELYVYKVSDTEAFIMSHATGNGGTAAVEYHVKATSLAAYDNAIFTNSGIAGSFQGSVNVAGSVYSRGTLDVGANVNITNNYSTGHHPLGVGDTLYDILEQETDLGTKIRVKGGDLMMAGSAKIGSSGAAENAVEGIFVDGTSDAVDGSNAWADEYSNTVPDLPLPSILDGLREVHTEATIDACIASEGYAGNDAAIAMSLYADWAQGTSGCFSGASRGGVYTGNIDLTKTSGTPGVPEWLVGPDADGNGLRFTQKPGAVNAAGLGHLEIIGTVVIDGDITFGDNMLKGLTYSASGAGAGHDQTEGASLVVNGDFSAVGEFYPPDGYLKGVLSPGTNDINSLGVVVHGDVNFEGSNSDTIAGFFFSDGQVNFNKQIKFGGTVISDLVNYAQVPDVYQVPNLKNYLPPGIPGGDATIQLTKREWRRVY
jgi:Tfp pilus assembly protein PilX